MGPRGNIRHVNEQGGAPKILYNSLQNIIQRIRNRTDTAPCYQITTSPLCYHSLLLLATVVATVASMIAMLVMVVVHWRLNGLMERLNLDIISA